METVKNMNEETLDGLRDLIRINIDASKGFEASAKRLESEPFKVLFHSCAQERRHQADELRGYLASNDEQVSKVGSAKGSLHRMWLKFRAALSGDNDLAIMSEAERGEDNIKELYRAIIVDTAGSPVNDILHKHIAQVMKRHDEIRDLRDALAST